MSAHSDERRLTFPRALLHHDAVARLRRSAVDYDTPPPATTEPPVLCGPEKVRVECLAEAKALPRYQEMKRPES